jgi:oxygen-independent coproporphyrinogen-3 oxidase
MQRSTTPTSVSAEFGVYVHIPFCAARCDYCAFATFTDRHHLASAYLEACRTDIERTASRGMRTATTVFVGGGTPTQVDPEHLGRVLDAIPMVDDAEVTVECNPDDVTEDLLREYRRHRVNRVSFGVQSMVNDVLQTLGRTHHPPSVERAVDAARAAGMRSFNLDLIYGAAGETLAQWEHSVRTALALDPPHISAYGLTVEAGTPLADDPERWPDDDDQADKYELADDLLAAAGLENYEVSNWARPGHESRHNRLYWAQADYAGFGCAAHSHESGRRWWNVRTPDRYIELIAAGGSPESAAETLDDETRRIEGLQLALRTREGVPRGVLPEAELEEFVEVRGERVVLTRRGRLLANEVSLRLQ